MQLYAAGKPCTLQLPRGRVLSQQQQRGCVELHNNSCAQRQGFKRPSCKYFESGQDPPKWLESFSIHFNRISFESFSMENIRHSWSFSLLQRNQRYLQNLPNVKKLLIALTTQWTIKWRQRGADVINVAAMCCCCYLFFAVDVSYRPCLFSLLIHNIGCFTFSIIFSTADALYWVLYCFYIKCIRYKS